MTFIDFALPHPGMPLKTLSRDEIVITRHLPTLWRSQNLICSYPKNGKSYQKSDFHWRYNLQSNGTIVNIYFLNINKFWLHLYGTRRRVALVFFNSNVCTYALRMDIYIYIYIYMCVFVYVRVHIIYIYIYIYIYYDVYQWFVRCLSVF